MTYVIISEYSTEAFVKELTRVNKEYPEHSEMWPTFRVTPVGAGILYTVVFEVYECRNKRK